MRKLAAIWRGEMTLMAHRVISLQRRGCVAFGAEADIAPDFIGTPPSTTLADLLTPLLVANPSSAMRAPLLWWLDDKFENGLTHGGQCRLRWRPVDSFFPALLF